MQFLGSDCAVFKAPIAAPHAGELKSCPSLFTVPTLPELSTPTCGAKSKIILPSLGQWLLNACQPVLPVNGKPASPPKGNISPHLV